MNILKLIREIILADPFLKQEVGNRIYFYKPTEVADKNNSFIVLNPVYDSPSTFASNDYHSESWLIQVDVEAYTEQKAIDITKRIRRLMWNLDLKSTSSQLDDYFKETKRYVKSRRYEGIPKNQYYKGERVD